MNLIRRASVAWVCGLAISVGFVGAPSVAAGPPVGGQARLAAPPGQDDLATFSADFWATHFGLPYTPGLTALMLTANSISVNGVGQWDPRVLGDDGVAALEAFAGEPALRSWDVEVAGVGGVVPTMPTAFAETYRRAVDGMNLTAAELAAAGLDGLSLHAAAGVLWGTMGEPVYAYGYAATIAAAGGSAVSVFVPMGTAPTQPLADRGAEALSNGHSKSALVGRSVVALDDGDGAAIGQGDVFVVAPDNCWTIYSLCVDGKLARYNACVDRARATFIAAIAACGIGCAALGPVGVGCFAVCLAAQVGAREYAISACGNDLDADVLQCAADYYGCLDE